MNKEIPLRKLFFRKRIILGCKPETLAYASKVNDILNADNIVAKNDLYHLVR